MDVNARCPEHDNPERFYLKSGLRNPLTRGLTFFVCGEPNCQASNDRLILNNYPMLECDTHPGKPVALQMFDKNENESLNVDQPKFLYRCTENADNWCGCYVKQKGKLPPLKVFSDVTIQSPYKSPTLVQNEFDLGSSFFNPGYGTSTPFVAAASAKNLNSNVDEEAPFAKPIVKLLANFEGENFSRLSDSNDHQNDFALSSDKSSIDEKTRANNADQSSIVAKDSQRSKNCNLAPDSSSYISVEKSESVAIVDESPSQSHRKPIVEKYRRIRLKSSSSSSDNDENNPIRPSTLINKNLVSKIDASISKTYVSPFHKPSRIRLEVSSSDDDDQIAEEKNPPLKLVEKSDVNLESSDTSSSVVELPPFSDNSTSIKTDVEDISSKLQEVKVKNLSTGDPQSSTTKLTNQEKLRETLKSSLKNLQAALPKAASLPDKGARLKAKISDIEAQLETLDKELKNSVKPYAAIFESDAEAHRRQQLYAINENDRHKLYGGRMNDARRIEVKVITQEAVKTLHTAMTQRPTESDQIDQPPGLRIELMPHQKQAVKWLTWRESQQPPGGVLADDMGLGKTLTMIALVLYQRSKSDEAKENAKCDHFFGDKLRKSQATLVICPASLIYQWQGEIERRVKPGFLNCLVYHGPKRETSSSRMASYDFVITSYETVSSEVGSGEDDDKKTRKKKAPGSSVLLSIAWERIILDEGHRIKNFKAGISKACCRLPASNRWILTGTPIHNKLTDFYSLLKFLRFEPFDEFQVWRRWIENKSEQGKRRLDAIIKGILLRRTKDQISSVTGKAIVDLPPRKSEVHQVDLSPLEKKIYDRIFMASKKQVADFIKQQAEKDYEMTAISSGRATQKDFGYRNPFQPKQVSKSENSSAKSTDFFTRSHILVLLLRLRQACSHFALMKEAIDVTAFDDLEPEDEATADNLIQQFTDMTILEGPGNSGSSDDDSTKIAGLFNQDFVSTKIKVLMQRLDQILDCHTSERKEKALVISQWAKLLDIVEFHLKKKGARYTSITGKTSPEERNVRMEKFNARNTGPVVMLLSLTAGGVGLNLVGANHLFLIDLHWNPALENQACDRIYRLGQERDVFVHKFVCKNTIEEKVFEIQQRKVGLAQSVLDGSTNRNVNVLSLNDIKYLFEL